MSHKMAFALFILAGEGQCNAGVQALSLPSVHVCSSEVFRSPCFLYIWRSELWQSRHLELITGSVQLWDCRSEVSLWHSSQAFYLSPWLTAQRGGKHEENKQKQTFFVHWLPVCQPAGWTQRQFPSHLKPYPDFHTGKLGNIYCRGALGDCSWKGQLLRTFVCSLKNLLWPGFHKLDVIASLQYKNYRKTEKNPT